MILRRFPGSGRLSQENTADFQFFGYRNVVVYAKSRDIQYAEHTAPLSIKSTLKGREIYEVKGVPIAVDENAYLVLNNNQPYASRILSNEEVVSFCLFFRDGLEREVWAALHIPHRKMLENAGGHAVSPVTFFQNLRRNDEKVFRRLKRLQTGVAKRMASQLWLDEQFHFIIEALLQNHQKDLREVEALPFLRQATRMEIYKRLHRAKDYLESCYQEPVSLTVLAEVACLSRHHFLRLFREVFDTTPHRYLTHIRLWRACKLMEESDYPVTEICQRVGFDDPGSFARLFKQRFGLSPTALRSTRRKKK